MKKKIRQPRTDIVERSFDRLAEIGSMLPPSRHAHTIERPHQDEDPNRFDNRVNALLGGQKPGSLIGKEVSQTSELVDEMGCTDQAVIIGHDLLDITIERLN